MTARLRVALLFGGRSAEHDVSVLSARNVFHALDPGRFEVVLIAVTRQGEWLLCSEAAPDAFPAAVPADGPRVALLPAGSGAIVAVEDGKARLLEPIDVLFPVLHGPFGEDGTVQGAAELAGVPYVGSGVLASAAAMDKDVAKRLLHAAGIEVASARTLLAGAPVPSFAEVAVELGRPLFVKPARLGSSVGVSKADDEESFAAAVAEAFRHDGKILIEAFLRGREVECGVLEEADGTLTASLPGEIVPTNRHAFYTYEAKYLDADGAEVKVPVELPTKVTRRIQDMSREAFRVLGCEGLARVDFFLAEDGRLTLNEVNTLPGFTNISMYPKAFEASGIGYSELVARLIAHALRRAGRA